MNQKTEAKLRFIIESWRKGDKLFAASKIKKLSKLDLFYLCSSHRKTLSTLLPDQTFYFKKFIENVLDGTYDAKIREYINVQ